MAHETPSPPRPPTAAQAPLRRGISVITCSRDPLRCRQMLDSVKATIGTPFETIVFDNREQGAGLCRAYNSGAGRAAFPYLCFIHEDVILPTPNWGRDLAAFAERTPNCGVIGFAGGTTARKNFLGWEGGLQGRFRFYDPPPGTGRAASLDGLSLKYHNPRSEAFAEVITLDGLFLFVPREVWRERPFDEARFQGFHFYDADFSFGAAQTHQNYVCFTADIYHYSGGTYNRKYYEDALVFQQKWKNALPRTIGTRPIRGWKELASAADLLVQLIQRGFPLTRALRHLIDINGPLFLLLLLGFLPGFLPLKALWNLWSLAKRLRAAGKPPPGQ